MKKVEEYLTHAKECREMARTASPTHRQQLEQMAVTWEQLAEARKDQLQKGDRLKDILSSRGRYLYLTTSLSE